MFGETLGSVGVSGISKIIDSSMTYFIKASFHQRNILSYVLTEKDNNM